MRKMSERIVRADRKGLGLMRGTTSEVEWSREWALGLRCGVSVGLGLFHSGCQIAMTYSDILVSQHLPQRNSNISNLDYLILESVKKLRYLCADGGDHTVCGP